MNLVLWRVWGTTINTRWCLQLSCDSKGYDVNEQMSTHDVVYVRSISITVIKQRNPTARIILQHLPTVYWCSWEINTSLYTPEKRYFIHDSWHNAIGGAQIHIAKCLYSLCIYLLNTAWDSIVCNIVCTGGHRTRVAAVTLDNMAGDALVASASLRNERLEYAVLWLAPFRAVRMNLVQVKVFISIIKIAMTSFAA